MKTPDRETVLLVDDDGAFRAVYKEILESEGYRVVEARTADEATSAFAPGKTRVVILDLMLPPTGKPDAGAAVADGIFARDPGAKIVVVSGAGDTSLALGLVRRGAYDFLAKPVDPDVLVAVVHRAAARLALEDRVQELETSLATRAPADLGLVGVAAPFLEARTLCERAAPTDVPVLVAGESGTGKEVFARYLHEKSARRGKPFVAVNCGALAGSLLESTLFGHKRGAFTGAVSDSRGLFVEADGGTLFLDEIGDMELALQVKLLRALESGEILPLGTSRPTTVDVRIVSATHKPLAKMVSEGAFRDDLFWRIRGIEVTLPRLADRPGDVLLLAQHFLNQARALVPRSGMPRLSAEVQRRLETHDWPGNLRELRHEMQRALVMAAGRDEILEEDLSPAVRSPRGAIAPAGGDGGASPKGVTLDEKIASLERHEIAAALAAVSGNRSQAAQALGLSRQGLLNKMARYGIR